jgi:RND family efflux transporter MFP subunit
MANKDELISQLRITRDEQSHPSKAYWWILLVVALFATIIVLYNFFHEPDTITVKIKMASVEVADSSDVRVLDATGYVVARRMATVSSKVTGKVAEIYIEAGMFVDKDQVVARLDDVNAKKSLELYRAQWLSSKTMVAESQARFTEAKLTLDRNTELARQHLVSNAALDKARADFEALTAQLATRRAEVNVAEKRLVLEQQNLDDMQLRAPFAGVVISKDSQPGEMISPMSAGGGFTRTGICTLVDMASLEIEVDVNESYIQRVRVDQFVQAVLEAYPDWKIPAKVIAIIPAADRQKATVKVRIGFQVSDSRILPEMGVKVAFMNTEPQVETESKKTLGIRVPTTAVRSDGDDKYVFVVKEKFAEIRKVTLSASYGSDVYISSGINAGEDFVVDIPDELQDGMRVTY